MNYLLTPLHHHFDSGFGATANSFKSAADTLNEDLEKTKYSLNGHLPINFLYRHAIELYLKSGIVIFHRRLRIPYGASPFDSEPSVLIQNKWKSFYKVHSIADLYTYLRTLFDDHSLYLAKNTNADWRFPSNVTAWVKIIEDSDPRSTFFRYPFPSDPAKDQEKSSMKQIEPIQLTEGMPIEKPIRAFLVENEQGEATRAYIYDDDPLQELSRALKEMAELFYSVHAAMRFELCDGW